eukprot:TRINITY_DN17408_c0_g1_i1.p1 TRINITY_DN17408_c0_g1~~TRINITY_DN17408_c0_g1_i1.p1  ORF type:complete len:132 (+),score=40.80 TRINITY_DN17408_c0_g1_i1:23-397(+)
MGNQIEKALANPENKEILMKLFNKFDDNKNGTLDKEEWHKFAKAIFKIEAKYAKEDLKKDLGLFGGTIGDIAFSFMDVEKFIDEMFLEADHDKNNEISFDEFQGFLKDRTMKEKLKEVVGNNIN